MLGDGESEAGWRTFFAWLKDRGLHGVDVVVSDSHQGLVKALLAHFSGCTWQRCQTHFMRNLLDATPKSLQAEMYQRVRVDPGGSRFEYGPAAFEPGAERLCGQGTEGDACIGGGI